MRKDFPELPLDARLSEKIKFISELSIIKEIKGLARIIKLKVNFESRGLMQWKYESTTKIPMLVA